MATTEERLQILKMVEAKRITPQEAARLLETLEQTGPDEGARDKGKAPQWLRVRVTDTRTGRVRINVNLPVGLVNVGMRMGAKFAPDLDGVAIQEVLNAVKTGQRGKILEVEDQDSGERVEIYTE